MTRNPTEIDIVDAHHHLWDLSRFPYAWLAPDAPPRRFGDHSTIKKNYLPEDYRTDFRCFNLVASVHVQANCGANDPVDETKWLQQLSDSEGVPDVIVAEADLRRPDAHDRIRRHADFPAVRGVRALVAWDKAGRWRFSERPGLLADPGFRQGAAFLADLGLSLDLVVVPEQFGEVAELASAIPDLKIAINHLGHPEPAEAGNAEAWKTGLKRLGGCEAVFLKVSGLWTIDPGWRAGRIRPFLDHALSVFGAERLMYGSNLPVEKVNTGAARQIEVLNSLLSAHPESDVEQVFSRTAKSFYRL